MKCANCESPAVYDVQNPGAEDQVFCAEHLPWFINLKHDLGGRVVPIIVTSTEVKSKGADRRKRVTEVTISSPVEFVQEA